VKWKLEIEMKLLGKNGIRIEIEIFFRMEITLGPGFKSQPEIGSSPLKGCEGNCRPGRK